VVTALDFGGVERHMEIVATANAFSAFEHRFVAIGKGGATESRIRSSGSKVYCLEQSVDIPEFRAIWSLYRHFRQQRTCVVHTHGAEANFHGLLAAALARVPVRIGEEIGIPTHGTLARHVFREVFQAAHKVIGVSPVVSNWLVQHGEAPQHKVLTIPIPAQLSRFLALPRSRTDNEWRIVFAGRLEPVKNPLGLLAAFKTLHQCHPNSHLWIVGDGSQRAAIEQWISHNQLQDCVRLFGFLPDPCQIIAQCDILIQPSLSEGFGLSMVEALSCGIPVVSTPVGAAQDVIEDGLSGWICNGVSEQDILQALQKAALIQGEKWEAMARHAHQSVQLRFSAQEYIRQTDALYQEEFANCRT
jgi:glycosyltransferase involved in cell wall biosynthesis